MSIGRTLSTLAGAGVLAAVVAASCGRQDDADNGVPRAAQSAPLAPSATAAASGEAITKTVARMPEGTSGSAIASALMAEWLANHPNSNWAAEEKERHAMVSSADNSHLIGQAQGQTYGQITDKDVALWKSETERMALAGSRVFHSADELGSPIGVSCDMCHPHAANTHPETYPKFQTQIGRVVLLRDMINWCIEHPLRGKSLNAEDPRMRALEGYILAQRSGTALNYGKH